MEAFSLRWKLRRVTVALAGSATDAFIGKDKGAGGVVHLQFSGAGTAAHTDIFSAPPKPVDS